MNSKRGAAEKAAKPRQPNAIPDGPPCAVNVLLHSMKETTLKAPKAALLGFAFRHWIRLRE